MQTNKAIVFRVTSRATEKELAHCTAGTAFLDKEDQEIAEMFSTRGLSFTTGTAVVVGIDEIRQEEARAIYNRKTRFMAHKLAAPGMDASLLFMGLCFGWIVPRFFRVLFIGCIVWAASTVWG